MEFTLKSCTFLLELFDYGLNQCFCHELDSIIRRLDQGYAAVFSRNLKVVPSLMAT